MATSNITTGTKPRMVPLQPGRRTDSTGRSVKNVLLLSVPDREYNLIRPHLEFVELPHRKMLHAQGEKIEHAHCPNDGMVSLVVMSSEGKGVEVGSSDGKAWWALRSPTKPAPPGPARNRRTKRNSTIGEYSFRSTLRCWNRESPSL